MKQIILNIAINAVIKFLIQASSGEVKRILTMILDAIVANHNTNHDEDFRKKVDALYDQEK